jgi:hypothetical protein
MTRRDWWIGVLLVALALLGHAAMPRYQWQHQGGFVWLRVDRWTGGAVLAYRTDAQGRLLLGLSPRSTP